MPTRSPPDAPPPLPALGDPALLALPGAQAAPSQEDGHTAVLEARIGSANKGRPSGSNVALSRSKHVRQKAHPALRERTPATTTEHHRKSMFPSITSIVVVFTSARLSGTESEEFELVAADVPLVETPKPAPSSWAEIDDWELISSEDLPVL
ncbi:hypothetical protein JCM3774_003074 [Rhodotorula dairenensis]